MICGLFFALAAKLSFVTVPGVCVKHLPTPQPKVRIR